VGRIIRISRAVGLLAVRLVLAGVVAAWRPDDALARREPDPTAGVEPGERPARPAAEDTVALLRILIADEGCVPPDSRHRACRAATRLAAAAAADRRVLEALEATLMEAARPGCVRRASVDALGATDTDGARRALGRMRAVARKRVEFEGGSELRALSKRLDALLG